MDRISFASIGIMDIRAYVQSDAGEEDPQLIVWTYDAAEGKFCNKETSVLRTLYEIEVFLKTLMTAGHTVIRVDFVYG